MIILFDSSTMIVELALVGDGRPKTTYQWEAGRTLARDILQFLKQRLTDNGVAFDSVTGIGVRSGPGSYTGLRIGLTVLNTLAESKAIPIVGASSDNWADICLARLAAGENDKLVMPEYGGEAHVTSPRK